MNPVVSDYSGFDFQALWKGRDRVTEVERSLLSRSLEGLDPRRLLELGTGFGRLLGCLTAVGQEVVALDFNAEGLASARRGVAARPPALWVAANLYHLPFTDGAFTGASMIRVYHHLGDPGAALTEIHRVLRSGSRLIVSYTPKPSVGTLVNDVQRALQPRNEQPFRSATFSRAPSDEFTGEAFPVIVSTRARFADCARSAGFEVESDWGTGFEEYRLLRRFPSDFFARTTETFGSARGFPVRFARLRRRESSDPPLPEVDRILACPRCRTGLGLSTEGERIRCPTCAFEGNCRDGVVDLRYVPEGTRTVGPPQGASRTRD
jgi:ubiquinone/menaquinone biosynthesis C-methylase UbiE